MSVSRMISPGVDESLVEKNEADTRVAIKIEAGSSNKSWYSNKDGEKPR